MLSTYFQIALHILKWNPGDTRKIINDDLSMFSSLISKLLPILRDENL